MEGGVLPFAWLAIIAFGIFMYVLLDGFVLGTGILFSLAPTDADRDTMMTSVAPVWDGNETWLVLGAVALFAAFPMAYAIVLPAMYLPFIIMLLGLVLRGVAFEFRFKDIRHRAIWDRAFHYGSVLATMAQGMVLGAFVQGLEVANGRYAGGVMDWLTPFSAAVGVALVAGYALLGSTWLIMKTKGTLREWAQRASVRLLGAVLLGIAVISIWVPIMDPAIARRWFSLPNFYFLSPVPLLTALSGYLLWRMVRAGRDIGPFLLSMALFVLGYTGLGISLWPDIVPPDIPYWEAAASASSQQFLLVGVIVTLPAVLFYTAYSYYVFKGKVGSPAED
jgi:cytochrome d ubiquinol oxidase subunit II